jgi:hypothetical protein
MLLDAVLAVGDVEWLTTAAEKAAYSEQGVEKGAHRGEHSAARH